MFDDSGSNDFRNLPKTVRLQILCVIAFYGVFTFFVYIFNVTTFALGFAGVFVAHVF